MATTMSSRFWRVEYRVTLDGSATALIQVRLYIEDSATATEDSGQVAVAAQGAVSTWNQIVHGLANAATDTPSHTAFGYLDNLKAFAPTWTGPFQTDLLVPASNMVRGIN